MGHEQGWREPIAVDQQLGEITHPRQPPAANLRLTTTDVVGAPGMTPAAAERISQAIDAPLRTQVKGG